MAIIKKLKKRIEELGNHKAEIVRLVEENGWLYNQRPKIIPRFTDSTLGFDIGTIDPERRSISEKAISEYQRWFSLCKAIIENNQQNRLSEYSEMYSTNYQLFRTGTIIFDDEIEASIHLLKSGFLRAAGAVAGVVLERHLKNLLRKHIPSIKFGKTAGLGEVNEKCKANLIYEQPDWRKVQHLTDLRNLCDHDKDREPTKEEVDELIRGVSKVIKTINVTIV